MTAAEDVLSVLDSLAAAGVAASVGGGWGVDALLGREARPHADVDLAVDADLVPVALDALARLGLEVVLDQRPARIVVGDGRRSVDLHPIRFAPDGTGRQAGLRGETFVYPPGSLEARGRVGGREVRCCTPELQLEFHAGYEPRDVDRGDMAALAAAYGLELPAAYRSS